MTSYAIGNGGRRVATGSLDGEVRVWDWTGVKWRSVVLGGPRLQSIEKIEFSVDGRMLVAEDSEAISSCYAEKNGRWIREAIVDHTNFKTCGAFDTLGREEWPHGFAEMIECRAIWRLQSNYFGVAMTFKPNVSFLERVG